MALLPILVLLIVFLYTLSISTFARTLRRKKGANAELKPGEQGPALEVSILVPFRNERKNLPHLLHDLIGQTYPAQKMEIIGINDHSEDGSRILFESLDHSGRDFSCLDLPQGARGKKAALAYGVEHASRPWIIQLDADCRIKPDFVSSHMAFLKRNPSDLLAGLVTTGPGRGGFLEHFERLDQLSLTGVAAASFLWGRAKMCSGANLAYSKELYLKTRVFDPSSQLASGDDMFLMIGARKLGKKLSFNLAPEAVVETAPVFGWGDYVKQRIRWGAKSRHYKMPDIQLLALLVVLCQISMVLYPLWIVLYPLLWPYFLGAWLVKITGEYLLLYRTSGCTGQRKSLNYFLPSSLLHDPVYLLVVLGMIFWQPAWKRKASGKSSSLD